MGAVRADRELDLEKPFVGLDAGGVLPVAVLGPQHRELARHERERGGDALVAQRRVDGAVRELVARAREPAAPELPVGAREESLRLLRAVGLLALAPEILAAD